MINPLPRDEITVRTEMGISFVIAGEARFYQNEPIILMLKDINVSENEFKVTFAENGKHSLSEKGEILKELSEESPFIGVFGSLIAIFLVMCLCRKIR